MEELASDAPDGLTIQGVEHIMRALSEKGLLIMPAQPSDQSNPDEAEAKEAEAPKRIPKKISKKVKKAKANSARVASDGSADAAPAEQDMPPWTRVFGGQAPKAVKEMVAEQKAKTLKVTPPFYTYLITSPACFASM